MIIVLLPILSFLPLFFLPFESGCVDEAVSDLYPPRHPETGRRRARGLFPLAMKSSDRGSHRRHSDNPAHHWHEIPTAKSRLVEALTDRWSSLEDG